MKYNLKDTDNYSVFESFSDMILCLCITLLMLIAILALNVGERLDSIISPSHFSGGIIRPRLYISAWKSDGSHIVPREMLHEKDRIVLGNNQIIKMRLFSPSTAEAATTIKNNKLISQIDGQTFSGEYFSDVRDFLKLACGIDPGHFKVAGQDAALLIPEFKQARVVSESNGQVVVAASTDTGLALKVLSIAWPVFSNRQYPVRSHSEYQEARTKIYVETMTVKNMLGKDENIVVIGQRQFSVPDDVKDGSLAWLLGFSSGLTEIHYLGEIWLDEKNNTNKRIDFFEKKGFIDCANAYRKHLSNELSKEEEFIFRNFTPWENLPFEVKKEFETAVAALSPTGTFEKAKDAYGKYLKELAVEAVNLPKISSIIIKDEKPNIPKEYLPPLVAYPEAWQAYIDYYDEENNAPPQWFFDDFLKPLGFDRRVVRRNN